MSRVRYNEEGDQLKIVNMLIIGVVALLSIAAGLAKVMQTEQEMAFLQGFGFSGALVIAFGLIQLAGGILLVLPKTRITGVVLAAAAFAVSALLIFFGGNWVFGLLSTIPVALACLIIYLSASIGQEPIDRRQ
jgi:hypothetical protein